MEGDTGNGDPQRRRRHASALGELGKTCGRQNAARVLGMNVITDTTKYDYGPSNGAMTKSGGVAGTRP